MKKSAAVVVLLLACGTAFAAGPQHFELEASFVPPAKAGASGAVSVLFHPLNPDVEVDESPAPRLKLALDQTVLVDKQPPPPSRVKPFDPDTAQFLDLSTPVTFPVAVAPGAPKGTHSVKASVTYFYCSRTERWCRKGSTDIEVAVPVR
jgi:hypothetical protein